MNKRLKSNFDFRIPRGGQSNEDLVGLAFVCGLGIEGGLKTTS